ATDPTGLAVSTCPGGTCQQVEGNVEDTIVVNGTMPDWTPNINPDGFYGSGAGGGGGESGEAPQQPIVVNGKRPTPPATVRIGAYIVSQSGYCNDSGCGVVARVGQRPRIGPDPHFAQLVQIHAEASGENGSNCASCHGPDPHHADQAKKGGVSWCDIGHAALVAVSGAVGAAVGTVATIETGPAAFLGGIAGGAVGTVAGELTWQQIKDSAGCS
ncbi:MAG: hypothetical protein GC153_09750, partial [Alphaproteobacteria bacterium]|nr:hypothetical protein [Alphaproteobacteria bacterium]